MLAPDLKQNDIDKLPKWQYLILSVVVILVFGNTLFNGYNMDDNLVTQHHVFTSKGLSAIPDILTNNYYTNNSDINFGYRPITHITFAIEHALFGESPFTSHLINVLLYMLTVLLLFKLMMRWFNGFNKFIPLIVALLFAVHPVHTEVVASIKNRDEILALLFALCSALAANKYANKTGLIHLVGASLFFILALLSKKSVYPLVVVIPVINYWLNKTQTKAFLRCAFVMAIPAAIIGADFIWLRSVYLLGISLLLYVVAYLGINSIHYQQQFKQLKQICSNSYFLFPLVGLLFAASLYYHEWVFTAIALGLLVPVYTNNQRLTTLFLVLLNMVLAIYADDEDAISMVLLSSSWMIYTMVKKAERDVLILTLGLMVLAVFGWLNGDVSAILILAQVALFFYVTHKKPIYGLLLAAITALVSAYFFATPIYQWSLVAISCYWAGKKYLPPNTHAYAGKVILLALFAMPLVLVIVNKKADSAIVHHFMAALDAPKQAQVYVDANNLERNNGIKEGRSLNYIENSLVAPHTVAQTIFTGLVTLFEYARLMVFPSELSFYYGYATIETANLNQPKVWLALVFYLMLLVLAYQQRNKNIIITIGIGWYLVCIVLLSNYVELVAGMVGERLAFTASVGCCLAVGGIIVSFKPQVNLFKPKLVEFFLLLILVVCAVKSFARNGDWKDAITLMSHDIKHLDNAAQAHNLLALNLLYASGNEKDNDKAVAMVQRAITHLEKSVAVYPHFFNTNYDLAKAYFSLNNFTQAREKLIVALQLDQDNLFALELMVLTCYNLQSLIETEYYANRYISLNPKNSSIHQLLINAMLITKTKDKALIYAKRATEQLPNDKNIQQMFDAAQQSGN